MCCQAVRVEQRDVVPLLSSESCTETELDRGNKCALTCYTLSTNTHILVSKEGKSLFECNYALKRHVISNEWRKL